MYLKMCYTRESGEPIYMMIEGSEFKWYWNRQWPDEYTIPFAIGEHEEDDDILIVDVYDLDARHKQTLVLFDTKCYIVNENGKTIDSFAT